MNLETAKSLYKKHGYRTSTFGMMVTILYSMYFGDIKEMAADIKYVKMELQDKSTTIAVLKSQIENLSGELAEHKINDKEATAALWRNKVSKSQSKNH